MQPGDTIPIQGGAGEVAGPGGQLARKIGEHFIATCSARNMDKVRGCGADVIAGTPSAYRTRVRRALNSERLTRLSGAASSAFTLCKNA